MRIAVTGPESCGKTELSVQLAQELGFLHLPELCRQYLSRLDRPYDMSDVLQMAKDQHDQFMHACKSADSMVADTESLVMRIWFREKYETESAAILDMWSQESFDLYLLCATDLPWVEDPLRENPYDRERLFDHYKEELDLSGRRYAVVTGFGKERLLSALTAIRSIG